MNGVNYPLGHTQTELDRLDLQAMLLQDPLLEKLVSEAKSVLEIGCGNGSNLKLLRQSNPDFRYTGIDIAPDAVAEARKRFHDDANAQFIQMDGASIDLPNESFDLVFTKLVLWSIGPAWTVVLKEALRLLSPGGTFYAMEPANDMIEIYPEKPALKTWMNKWDKAIFNAGMDTYIGSKVATGLKKAGFSQVDSKFFPIIASASEQDRYSAIVSNLKGFYMGPAAEMLGLPAADSAARTAAIKQLEEFGSDSLVMDALFVSWARK
ncbi:MAG: class I SAM-dependent methyltransferase [Candidatus Obscuribacterales bacterium]|nr:class I SAM-dependent methyltransferase [Candidatus Obscuribacterales bacterium]